MNILIFAPILIPLLAAASIQIGAKFFDRMVGTLSLVFSCVLFVCTTLLWQLVWQKGAVVAQAGGWDAPVGIVFVADLLAATMTLITAFVALCFSCYEFKASTRLSNQNGYFVATNILLAGVNGSFLSGDLFNLFVWFEVMLMGSFVLLVYERKKEQFEGTLKYMTLNLVGSFLFLTATALAYGSTGTLNMAELSVRIANMDNLLLPHVALSFLLIAFGLKAGVFPLYWWLPASYHTPRAATSALLAGLLTKVGVYALLRTFTLLYPHTLSALQPVLVLVAVATMIAGVFGAASQFEIRRILSFHIISQIGYMILGLAFFTKAAIAATVFYVLHHIVVKTNLFFIGGIVEHLRGTSELKKSGALLRDYPVLAVLFLIPALSLAGLPPLSGFFAKFAIIRSGFEIESYAAIGVALFVGLLTLFSMMKIWMEGFWKQDPDHEHFKKEPIPFEALTPVVIMAAVTLAIGLWPDLLFAPANRISEELLNPSYYVDAVMRGSK